MTPTPEQERLREGAGYTPGPWAAKRMHTGGFDIFDPRGRDIVTIYGGGVEVESLEANARLIAAAPELLEALEDALEFIEGYSDVVDGSYGEPSPNRAMSLVGVIQSAIRKARGELWAT